MSSLFALALCSKIYDKGYKVSYGLTSEDLKTVQKKIKNQEKYLKSNTFVTSSGQSRDT